MQEKATLALSLLTTVVVLGYLFMQFFQCTNDPHLRRAYSGKMEFYRAAQLATNYEMQFAEFLGGHRWPGSHFGILKHCPTPSLNGSAELSENRTKLAQSYLIGKGIEIGQPLFSLDNLDAKKVAYSRHPFVELHCHSTSLDVCKASAVTAAKQATTAKMLSAMSAASVDFIVAHHILQQSESPLSLFDAMLRVLQYQGILLLTVPNACYGSNRHRVVTDWRHFEGEFRHKWWVKSHHEEHLREWALSHFKGELPNNLAKIDDIVSGFMEMSHGTSYDYHTWDQESMSEFLVMCRTVIDHAFVVKDFVVHEQELLVVLQKTYGEG